MEGRRQAARLLFEALALSTAALAAAALAASCVREVRFSLDLPAGERRYSGLVGTGGIGHGEFFLLDGSRTLGREESRPGRFLDRRDYCKLHIICHYVKVLLGEKIDVYPIGRIGDDPHGQRLADEMARAGVSFREEVASGAFPGPGESFTIPEEEWQAFLATIQRATSTRTAR